MKELGWLEKVLEKPLRGISLTKEEITSLLRLREQHELELLFSAARTVRSNFFYNKVFLYGFVYFSTWCKNSCSFCAYRKENNQMQRYRKSTEEIMQVVEELYESGVHLVDLTMGEDPRFHSPSGFDSLVTLIDQIKQRFIIPVMVSPGLVSENVLKRFAQVGADWYACYQETFNQDLFKQLRLNQGFLSRLYAKRQAAEAGLLLEEGLLLGVGESDEDIANAMLAMKKLGAHQVRVMSFVPQAGSPMQDVPSPIRQKELAAIAVLRLLFPDKLIPASLDVDGIEGLADRLKAGANVVTSIIPPKSGLAGVAQHSKDIDQGYRTVSGILPVLQSLGLEAADRSEYIYWLSQQQVTHGVPLAAIGE